MEVNTHMRPDKIFPLCQIKACPKNELGFEEVIAFYTKQAIVEIIWQVINVYKWVMQIIVEIVWQGTRYKYVQMSDTSIGASEGKEYFCEFCDQVGVCEFL